MKKALPIGVLVVLLAPPGPARAEDQPSGEAERVQRLSNLCKVWGAVRYQHPFLAHKDIDWDAALVKALPKAEAAKTPEEFAAAVQGMLGALGDPATRVSRTAAPAKPGADPKDEGEKKLLSTLGDGVLAIDLRDPRQVLRLLREPKLLAELRDEIAKAGGVIVDCRTATGYDPLARAPRVAELLCSRQIQTIGHRSVIHSGYKPQSISSSGGYYSAFETRFSESLAPPPGHKAPRVAFLLGERDAVPAVTMALQSAGDGFVVVRGKSSDDLVIPQRTLPLAKGFEVILRTAELVTPDGGAYTFRPDAEVAADADAGHDGPAYKAALALLKGPKAARRDPAPKPLPQGVWRADKDYAETKYPDREHRLLALFRFWTVINDFYPYRHLLDRDWDSVLTEFVPKFLAARDEREYVLAVMEMATHVPDGHTGVFGSAEAARFFGVASPPIGLRWIEDAPVVTELYDEKAAKDAGVRVGDAVVTVDGEPVAKRMERIGKYTPGATPQGHRLVVVRRLLSGEEGSACKLTVRGADGKDREVELPRRSGVARSTPPGKREAFEVLPDNLGYADLTRLEVAQIDAMLEKLKDTTAIVFDLRGYPRGVAWQLAPRLNVKNARYAAAFQRPVVGGGEPVQFSFLQPVAKTDRWQYKGKTVTLIDERAISQAEHTGLFLEAACGTTFVGSHTNGSNGDVTDLVLPGKVSVLFTGHDVRHADGRQLQRVGLVPHVEVRPTIRGIREGKDEVLDRAIKYLKDGK